MLNIKALGIWLVRVTVRWGWAYALFSLIIWFALRPALREVALDELKWNWILGVGILSLIGVALSPLLWQRLMRPLWPVDRPYPSTPTLYKAYSRSWLGRYIPGRIWMFAGRLRLCTNHGVPVAVAGRSMFFEAVLAYGMLAVVGAALAVATLAGGFVGAITIFVGGAILTVATRAVLGTSSAAERRYWPGIQRLQHLIVGNSKKPPFKEVAFVVSGYALTGSLQVGAFMLLAASVVDLSMNQTAIIGSAWAFSILVGYLAFVVPAGIGVRDGLGLLLVTPVLGAESAAIVVLASRALTITTDMVFVAMTEVWVGGIGLVRHFQPAQIR